MRLMSVWLHAQRARFLRLLHRVPQMGGFKQWECTIMVLVLVPEVQNRGTGRAVRRPRLQGRILVACPGLWWLSWFVVLQLWLHCSRLSSVFM